MSNLKPDKIRRIPVPVAIKPSDAWVQEVLKDRWWAISTSNEIYLYHGSPQCNPNRNIAQKVGENLPDFYEVRKIPIVFLPHSCKDYIG